MQKQLMPGMRLTIISMGGLANTDKTEIELFPAIHPRTNRPCLGCKPRGKRKGYILRDADDDTLIFEGWDLPVKVDSDLKYADGSSGWRGNACINLAGDPVMLKDYVENRNLNAKFSQDSKSKILVHSAQGSMEDEGVPLYPDMDSSGHAPMQAIRDKLTTHA